MAAEHAPSINALFQPYEGVRNILKVGEFAIAYFEELDLHFPVQRPFERNSHNARLFSQSERLHRLGQLHQEPLSRRVSAANGHTDSMGTWNLDRY